jgi:FAD/FMN-containing dehydrogenase
MRQAIQGFEGALIGPGDDGYDSHREVWNAMVDRRPALIARCTSAADVAAAIRHARERGLEIGVKCGGHSVLGLSVPQDGLMVDLTPMGYARVDPDARRAVVGGGALLRSLDRAAQMHGLATTAGNVSHTGVGGLTLGGGMGWLARQAGLSCDNVEAYTVVTADGETIRATATDHPDLFWGLRGGGGNFGVVTEFEFRLHPVAGHALVVELSFESADATEPMRRWRDLLPDAPREANLTADAVTVDGRPMVLIGYVWVGDHDDGLAYLPTMRGIGTPAKESVRPMSYVDLQTIGDEAHHHGRRRYAAGHYLTELSDGAIDAFLTRGVTAADGVDWSRIAAGGFQAYGGAIGEVANEDSAFSHRDALVEFFGGQSWTDPAEDEDRMASARVFGAVLEPFASGVYVNALFETGEAGVRRAYGDAKLVRLAAVKRTYDPENVFHLNQNIAPPGALGPAVDGSDVVLADG